MKYDLLHEKPMIFDAALQVQLKIQRGLIAGKRRRSCR